MATGIGPHIRLAGLAGAGVQERYRRLVGVRHPAGQHEALVRVVQRLQGRAGLASPTGQGGA